LCSDDGSNSDCKRQSIVRLWVQMVRTVRQCHPRRGKLVLTCLYYLRLGKNISSSRVYRMGGQGLALSSPCQTSDVNFNIQSIHPRTVLERLSIVVGFRSNPQSDIILHTSFFLGISPVSRVNSKVL